MNKIKRLSVFFSNSFFRSGTFTLQWLRSSNNKDIRLIHVVLQEKKMKIVIYNEHIFYRINLCNVRHVECFFFKIGGRRPHPNYPIPTSKKKKKQQKTKKPRISKLSNSKSVAGRLLRDRYGGVEGSDKKNLICSDELRFVQTN